MPTVSPPAALPNASPTLLLMLAPPHHQLAYHGYQLAAALHQQQYPFRVFFYQDAVNIANRLRWQPQDAINLTRLWQQLDIPLPVCVSAALQRGITDTENATRHQLQSTAACTNLAEGFSLVGLGQLSEAIAQARHVLQF